MVVASSASAGCSRMKAPRAQPPKRPRLEQPRFCPEFLERGFRASAEMADDLGGAEAAEARAGGEVAAMRQPVEEAAGVEVAGAGGVDQPRHLLRRDRVRGAGGDDDRSFLAARQRGDLAMAAHFARRRVEIRGLVERTDLGLVGEFDVVVGWDESSKICAFATLSELIGHRENVVIS